MLECQTCDAGGGERSTAPIRLFKPEGGPGHLVMASRYCPILPSAAQPYRDWEPARFTCAECGDQAGWRGATAARYAA